MRIFNRIVMVLLLAGLFVLGVFCVVYSLDALPDYRLSDLPQTLGLSSAYESVNTFVENVENGNLTAVAILILAGVALVGLILLIAEFKPPTPRLVQMQRGTYVTREAVRDQVLAGADRTGEVMDSAARVKARRSPGANVNLKADVRRGEDLRRAGSSVREQVANHLGRVGIPVNRIKVDLNEKDPRSGGEKRVQ